MQKLSNGIVKLLFKLKTCPDNALFEGQWLVGDQIRNYLLDVIMLLAGIFEGVLQVVGFRKILVDRLYGFDEHGIKLLSAPLYGVSDSIRKVLDSAG